jgi:hypothetical protein
MKVAFVLATHQSKKIRPYGSYMIDRFLTSLRNSYIIDDYTVFLFDNSSEIRVDLDKYSDMDIRYTYIEDQMIRGATGTWNDGALQAFNEGYDKIYICNDDLILNKSINYLIANTLEDNVIYGPLCQPSGIQGLTPQKSDKPIKEIINITGKGEVDEIPTEGHLMNGLLFGFTNKFYDTYKLEDGYLFNSDEKYIWAGNECEFQLRLWKKGVKSYLVGPAWIYHEKVHSWKYHYSDVGKTLEQFDNENEQKSLDYEQNWKDKMEELPFENE